LDLEEEWGGEYQGGKSKFGQRRVLEEAAWLRATISVGGMRRKKHKNA